MEGALKNYLFLCQTVCSRLALFPPLVMGEIVCVIEDEALAWNIIYLSDIRAHFPCLLSSRISCPKDQRQDLLLLFLLVCLIFDQWLPLPRLLMNIWPVDWASIYLNKSIMLLGPRLSHLRPGWLFLCHILKSYTVSYSGITFRIPR